MGQQQAVQAQNQSNQDWEATQRAAAAKANAADEAARQKSQAALNTSQDALSQQSQQAVQQTAQNNLTNQMLAGTPAAGDANVQVLGQPQGGSDTAVTSDMASRVTAAARQAQGRIKALAGLTSYGGGYGDMGAAANSSLADSAEQIKLQGDIRDGITKTLGVTQQIQPLQYAQGSNVAGSLAGTLAGLAGKGGGNALAKAFAPT